MTNTSTAVPEPGEDLSRPPVTTRSPSDWAKQNLFNSTSNTIITLLFAPIAAYLLYRFFLFVFINGRWEPVARNLELFMVGQFPREERWRIIAQLIILAGSLGAAAGTMRVSAQQTAIETGEDWQPTSWKTYLSSYWAVLAFFALVLIAFVRTPGPWLMAGAAALVALGFWALFARLPASFRPFALSAVGLGLCSSFQVLSGTGGWAWVFSTIVLIPALNRIGSIVPRSAAPLIAGAATIIGVAAVALRPGILALVPLAIGIYAAFLAKRGDRVDAARTGLVVVAGAVVFFVWRAIGLSGIDWAEWGGLHLNLVATVAGIGLAFPLGVLLALGRRSSLPAVRVLSVAYIEFFRGAPLITFLFSARFFLGFFLDSDTPLSLTTRSIAAITLFSAAYIAEIIRGGLQAVPKGQIEAGQAQGLSQAKIMRLIVLPQALRAVIPAMVGQFISLFKDTSLLSFVDLPEFLKVRDFVHAQADFRGFGIAETMTFLAVGFFAIAYTMSRESQRLEKRLDTGR